MSTAPRKLSYYRQSQYDNLNDDNHDVTSDETEDYNCAAWALGFTDRRMWPDPLDTSYTWPDGIDRDDSLQAFVEGFRRFGFESCPDAEFEPGYEKICLYADDVLRPDEPLHVARQLSDSAWTSKLGPWEDIKHPTPDVLTSSGYGQPRFYFRRPIPPLEESAL